MRQALRMGERKPFAGGLNGARLAAVLLVALACAAMAGMGVAGASEYAMEKGELKATDTKDGQPTVVWTLRLAGEVHATKEDFQKPVVVGPHLFANVGNHLYILNAAQGVVLQRIDLPERCSKLEADGTAGVVAQITPSWGPEPRWTRSYHVGLEHHDVPFTRVSTLILERIPARLAPAILEANLKAAPKPLKLGLNDRTKPEARPFVEATIGELMELEKRDPTNLWLGLYRGEYLYEIGRKEEAQVAFESVFQHDPQYDTQLIGMVNELDAFAPALAERAFERGMKALYARGYQPEMCSGLINLMISYGAAKDIEKIDPNDPKNLDRMNQIGERLWVVAPYAEMVHFYYDGLSRANDKAGRSAEAATWKQRAVQAMANDGPFGSMDVIDRSGQSATLMMALLAALMMAFFVKTVRVSKVSHLTKGPYWKRTLVFRFWTKAEQVGFLICIALIFFANYQLSRGIKIISISAAQPLAGISGFAAHPANLEYWKKAQGNPDGDLHYAMYLQEAGDLEGAAALYARLPQAQAKNNLGVIRDKQGKAEEAKALYEQALAADPTLTEAACNLGRNTDDPALLRRVKYGGPSKLLARPNTEQRDEAMANYGGAGTPLFLSLAAFSSSGEVSDTPWGTWLVYLMLILGGLMVVVSLFLPHVPPPEDMPGGITSKIGWGMGFLVPGTARQWSVFGTAALTVFFFSYFVSSFLQESEGMSTNFVESIAFPNFMKSYGPVPAVEAGKELQTPLRAFVISTQNWWLMLFAVNLAVVGVGEWLCPDPLGAFAKKKAPEPKKESDGTGEKKE